MIIIPLACLVFHKILNFPEMKMVPASDIIFMDNLYPVKTIIQHVISANHFSAHIITRNLLM